MATRDETIVKCPSKHGEVSCVLHKGHAENHAGSMPGTGGFVMKAWRNEDANPVPVDICVECGTNPQYDGATDLCKECDTPAVATKPTNPKDALSVNRIPMSLWPETATAHGALVLLHGALKYGRANWRDAGVNTTVYIDAARRHLALLADGEDLDRDSGRPHAAHVMACMAIILDADAVGMLNDDRPTRGGMQDVLDELTPHVARLKSKHAGKNPKHYTIADNKEEAV